MIFILILIVQYQFARAQISADFSSGGAIRIGESVTACSSVIQGAVKFDSSDNTFKYCDATQWKFLVADPCSTSLPTDWTFTNLTGQSRSTVVTSSIHQVTGIGSCMATVTVSGIGSTAEYQICSDSSCSTVDQTWGSAAGSIANNKYIQLRQTTSAYGNVVHTASVTVGHRQETWTATTSGDCTDVSPALGTLCADGTFYVGQSPDGNVKMYTTPCNPGMFWDGTACSSGRAFGYQWSNNNTVATGVTNATTGEANTTTLAGLSNADSPYPAASYCYNYNGYGQTDWYLPSTNEANVLITACGLFPDSSCSDSGNRYWLSRETTVANASRYTFAAGVVGTTKTDAYRTRCVRKD